MKKYTTTLYHSILVGFIAAVFFIISGWLSAATWVLFFAWANYFLHECSIKKSLKLMLALFIGIVISFLASHMIAFLKDNMPLSPENESLRLYINGAVIFVVATFLIFLECIKGWGQFVPATFLGTVLFFALGLKVPGTSLHIILIKLIIPLVLGIVAGYLTIYSREKLDKCLNKNCDLKD